MRRVSLRRRQRAGGSVLLALGLALTMIGLLAGSAAAVQNVPLHNATANTGTDCPDTVTDYFHFIIAPNNGTYTIQTITLNLGSGGPFVFTGSAIIKNGTQADNVFVAVPATKTFTDLVTTGSSADVTPDTPAPQNFTLSHLCDGTANGTTTTTTTTSTTTTSTTTTSTTTTTTTSTTTSTTTTTAPTTTTTAPPTTLGAAVGGVVVTQAAAAGAQLAFTGSSTLPLLLAGGVLVLIGALLLLNARRVSPDPLRLDV